MEQLARFLGVSCDKAQLEGMVESCNQLIEQCCNSEALSMCRGERERKGKAQSLSSAKLAYFVLGIDSIKHAHTD